MYVFFFFLSPPLLSSRLRFFFRFFFLLPSTDLQLFDHPTNTPPALRNALTLCCRSTPVAAVGIPVSTLSFPPPLPRRNRRYVVFGSSIGLLTLYGALGLNLRTTGYEILPLLAHASAAVAQSVSAAPVALRCAQHCCFGDTQCKPPKPSFKTPHTAAAARNDGTRGSRSSSHCSGSAAEAMKTAPCAPCGYDNESSLEGDSGDAAGLEVVCGDMLEADLSLAAVVLLTSQCWDAALAARVDAKLAMELPPDAVVVDYTDRLSYFGADGRHNFSGWRFRAITAEAQQSDSGAGGGKGKGGGVGEGGEFEGEDSEGGGDCGGDSNNVNKCCRSRVQAAAVAPVSWNQAQRFYVFQKVRVDDFSYSYGTTVRFQNSDFARPDANSNSN